MNQPTPQIITFKPKKKATTERKIYGVYIPSVLSMKINIHVNEIGRNIKQNLEQKIVSKTEGKSKTTKDVMIRRSNAGKIQ